MTTEYIHLKGSFAIGNTLAAAGFPGASLADDIVLKGTSYHTGISKYTEWRHAGVVAGYYVLDSDTWGEDPHTPTLQYITAPDGTKASYVDWIVRQTPGPLPPPPPPPGPIIMIVERVTTTEQVVSAGNTAHFSWQLDNFNSTEATNSVGIYLSRDPTIDASDNLISSYTATLPANHATYYSNIPITIPGTVAPGNYYMGLLIDFENPSQSHASAGVPITILHAQTGVKQFHPLLPRPT